MIYWSLHTFWENQKTYLVKGKMERREGPARAFLRRSRRLRTGWTGARGGGERIKKRVQTKRRAPASTTGPQQGGLGV